MAIRFSVESAGVTRTFELKRSVVTFGRSAACTVPIDDPALSRTHCQFEVEGDGCFVRDLASRNGTFMGSDRVSRALLEAGSAVRIGSAVVSFLGITDTAGLTTSPRSPTAQWTARLFAPSRKRRRARSDDREADLAHENGRLHKLLDMSRRVASELEPERVLTAILDAAVDLVDAERGFLVTVEKDRLFIPVARDFWKKDIASPAFEVSRSVALEVVRRAQPVITEDASEDPRFDEMVSVHDLKIRSVLCVPLKDEGRVIGALYLDNRFTRGSFSERDLAGIEIFAEQAAVALKRSDAFEKLREQAQSVAEEAKLHRTRVRDLETRLRQLELAGGLKHDYVDIVGRSPEMLSVLHLVDRVAQADLPVLIRGESGVGKELFARALHSAGRRSKGPLVVADCSSFASSLVERELFGHAVGAFSGASESRPGLIESADHGTLFLDEIGEMDVEQQKRLLRVLETGEIRRLGEVRTRKVDVRFVAATHRDLAAMIDSGAFREDLYFRLKGVEIEVPPLRRRLEDLPALIDHFAARRGRALEVSPKAMRLLAAYRWPGNVRELDNEVARLVVAGVERVAPADLSPEIRRPPVTSALPPGGLKAHIEQIERRVLIETMEAVAGNKTKAAEQLGLSRLGLRKKLARYGLATDEGS